MKRIGRFLILISFFFFLFSLGADAASTEDIERFSSFDTIYEALPEGISREDIKSLLDENDSGSFWKKGEIWIRDALNFGIRENLKLFSTLCIFLLVGALFESMKKGFLSGTDGALSLLLLFASSLPVLKSLNETANLLGNTLSGAANFMLATLPVSTILLSMCGATGSAALYGFSLNFLLTSFSTLLYTHLLPLIRTLFCFSFIEGIGNGILGEMSKLIKKTVKNVCTFFFVLATALISLRQVLCSAADSVAMRSIRFAAGTFIPVIGSAIGEQTRVLSASLNLIKSQSGIIFLSVLLFLLLRPVLLIYFRKITFSLLGAMAQTLGVDVLKRFLQSVSGILDLMLALALTQGCYLIFLVSILLQSKGSM